VDTDRCRDIGEAAWAWVLGQVREQDGPWLPEVVEGEPDGPAPDRDSFYAGIGGLAPVLAEIALARQWTAAETALAGGIVARLSAPPPDRIEPSMFDGLSGDVLALRLLAPGTEQPLLRRLAGLRAADGWTSTVDLQPSPGIPLTDVGLGTAGVVLAAAWAGGDAAAELMSEGGRILLERAEPTEAGLDWRMYPGYRASTPNFSHGTAGVASALAVAGAVLGRDDFTAAARDGARHLLSAGDLGDDGFVIPHTIPYSTREVEPVTYGWCHGPTGTSLVFTALALAGVTEVAGRSVADLHRRCLRSVLGSGLPARLRPGFWDNDGRCCGTAGVGDALLDAAQNSADPEEGRRLLEHAATMGEAVLDRAEIDADGARWRFLEHRQTPPVLPPNTSWMQGAGGIAAFLLRLARVRRDGLEAPVVDRLDQWWAVPARLRTAGTGPGQVPAAGGEPGQGRTAGTGPG
jgi:hypothetical protein